MSPAGYVQHGRRHGPNGSDPIPGLGGDVTQIWYSSPSVTIAAGSSGYLTWDGKYGDDPPLIEASDVFSTNDLATFMADGTYAITVQIMGSSLTAGTSFTFSVKLGGTVPSTPFTFHEQSSPALSGVPTYASMSHIFRMGAGDEVVVSAYNFDSSSRDFDMYALLTKIG